MKKTDSGQHGKHPEHGGRQKGHGPGHAHMMKDFRRRFWISIIATIPVLILSSYTVIF